MNIIRYIWLTLILLPLSAIADNGELPVDSVRSENKVPALDIIDSLYLLSLTKNIEIKIDIPYDFSEDSVPAYPDSTYYERIETLNITSPFDLRYNEEVRKYIMFFSTGRAGMILRAMAAEDFYFPLFEEVLDKYNLPQEFKYLAVVESALNPNARSRAGAVGLWQFMPSTGRLYGLKYNSRIDQRRDMWASTEAACRHFIDLYNIYHDWNLVLAAYNSGPGNVNKAIRRAGDSISDYWHIRQYLPRETRGYVPAFIAVNYLMNYPREHNLRIEALNVSLINSFDTVYVDKKMYLKHISQWLDIPLSTLKALNPQYRRGYIPASAKHKYKITLPVEAVPLFIRYRQEIISGIDPRKQNLPVADNTQ